MIIIKIDKFKYQTGLIMELYNAKKNEATIVFVIMSRAEQTA